jgi:hypothetical protein
MRWVRFPMQEKAEQSPERAWDEKFQAVHIIYRDHYGDLRFACDKPLDRYVVCKDPEAEIAKTRLCEACRIKWTNLSDASKIHG